MGSFAKLRRQADRQLREHFEESREWRELASASPDLFRNLKDYCLAGGKRLRPVLFMASYKAYKGVEAPPELSVLPVVLELLHGFVLLHDDLVDRAEERRCKPSFQRQMDTLLGKRAGCPSGEDIALISGDILYSYALRSLANIPVGPELQLAATRRLTEIALQTGKGELMEMLSAAEPLKSLDEERILEVYDLKTCRYSFCLPILLGALFSEHSSRREEALINRLGIAAGRAFQIADDIDDIFGARAKSSGDLVERRRTLLLLWTRKLAKPKDRRILDDFLLPEKSPAPGVSVIKDMICLSGALEHARKEAAAYKKEALSLLFELNISKQGRTRLGDILESVLGSA